MTTTTMQSATLDRRHAVRSIVAGAFLAVPRAARAAEPDAALAGLMIELREVHAKRELAAGPREFEKEFARLHEEHWTLREKIDAIYASSVAGLRIKALAAQIAFADDPDADCNGTGSFVSLANSIIRDLLALGVEA